MTRKWHDLSTRTRHLIIVGGTLDGVLRLAALVDLARRPAEEVRGSKLRWAAALIFVNSVGLVPLAYFRKGRRTL